MPPQSFLGTVVQPTKPLCAGVQHHFLPPTLPLGKSPKTLELQHSDLWEFGSLGPGVTRRRDSAVGSRLLLIVSCYVAAMLCRRDGGASKGSPAVIISVQSLETERLSGLGEGRKGHRARLSCGPF